MNSTYGTVKPSLVDVANDVEIWYSYRPSRSNEDPDLRKFTKINDVTSVFEIATVNDSDIEVSDKTLPGMYTLNLPISIFGRKGIYTVYIKPKEIFCTIKDVGSLAAYPDTNGIIIDINDYPSQSNLFSSDNLVGYRIEYFDLASDGLKRQNYYRIITSCNRCEPVSQNLQSSNTSSKGYRFNESATLCFITVTPSTNPKFKSNSKPYIGAPNQRISITNTKFDPVMMEIEVVEHDIETLSIMQEGEMVRNFDNGRVSIYNFDGEIYKQFEYATIKDNYTTKSIAELKSDKTGNIDYSLDLEELKES